MIPKIAIIFFSFILSLNLIAQSSLSIGIIRRSDPLSLKDSPSSFGTKYPFYIDGGLFKTKGVGLAYNYTLPKKMLLSLQVYAARAVLYNVNTDPRNPDNPYNRRFLARLRGDVVLNIGKKFILHKKYFDNFYILAGVAAMNIGTNYAYSISSTIPTKNYNYFFVAPKLELKIDYKNIGGSLVYYNSPDYIFNRTFAIWTEFKLDYTLNLKKSKK